MTHHFIHILIPKKERASAFISRKRGTITVEAAIVVAFFFFTMIALTYLLEIMALRTTMRNALHVVGKEVAVEMYGNSLFLHKQVEKKLVEQIGRERLDDSFIVHGSKGIDCSKSKKWWNTTIVDLNVTYQIRIPIPVFRLPCISQTETIRIKGWTGYERGASWDERDEVVYITEHGMVYHKKQNCTYLDLSVKAVLVEQIGELRNQSGGVYRPCMYCGGISEKQQVYVTDYGNRYHSSLSCSRLKRRVYEVPLKEIYGLGGCSKCAE